MHCGAGHTSLEVGYRALETNMTVTKKFLVALKFSLTVDRFLIQER